MLACFLCGFSYLGMTDRESVVPFAADYFKNALVGWAHSETARMQKIMCLMKILGSSPHPTVVVAPVAAGTS